MARSFRTTEHENTIIFMNERFSMNDEKKIVWIVNQYSTPVEKHTRQIVLSQRLEEHGYKVFIFCGSTVHNRNTNNLISKTKEYDYRDFDGAHFYIIKTNNYSGNIMRVLISLQFQRNIWKLRKQFPKPDVIVSDFSGLFGNVFLKWKNKYGTKVIYDILDLWPENFIDVGFLKMSSIPAKLLYSMEHKSYREADGIIFSFEGGKDYIIEKGWDMESGGDVDINKVGYLNNGVDLETFNIERINLVLDDPDLETDMFKVVYLGAIRRANNTELIVNTAKVLQERNIDNVLLLIYGDGNRKQLLEDRAKKLGLKNIKFKGRLPVEFAPNLLSRCNLNLFNFMNVPICRFGLSPNKLFMYFASGKPILSTVRPNYELVESRGCGIVSENNSEAIADSIIRFSKMSKDEYDGYCKNCLSVAEEFDYKNLVNELIKKIEG